MSFIPALPVDRNRKGGSRVTMITLEGLRKIYPPRRNSPATVALERITTTINDGSFVTVVGPSGCGKTTLLQLIAGFEQPSEGRILVDGDVVTAPGRDRAVVFQQASLYPWLTVEQNISFGLMLRDGARRVDRQRVANMIETMGLQGFERFHSYQLSGGMQQRVAIARALIVEPKILLMDEPFGALDAQTRGEMQDFLLHLWRSIHPTVVFITHDVEEAVLLADRVLIMSARPGRVVRDLHIGLPRPRTWDMILWPEFVQEKREVLAVLRPSDADTTQH